MRSFRYGRVALGCMDGCTKLRLGRIPQAGPRLHDQLAVGGRERLDQLAANGIGSALVAAGSSGGLCGAAPLEP
jgi:hypothetical protein